VTAKELLILGGTGEASALANAVLARFGDALNLTTSLAGRTQRPRPPVGRIRIGGFGGATGLAAYLTEHRVERLIDATHPFAARISTAARLACEEARVPRLLLLRPPWRRHSGDRWIEVDDMTAAAAVVGRIGRRAFLTVGAGEIACFAAATGVRFLVRLVDPPQQRLPLHSYEVVIGRGPFTLAEERHRLEHHAIDVLVCKASGGAATEAKICAARQLGLPVVMVRRPPPEPGDAVETVEAAVDWLAGEHPFQKTERVS
jgi:precorrin-6A/cobalt-precorrin-6A reductase